jgi:predicted RNase H-like nuclease
MTKSVRASARTCAGVDGCRGGWVVASRAGAHLERTIAETVSRFDIVGIDMPIGLPDGGVRAADAAARRLLGRRASTIFPTPPRAALGLPTHVEASEAARLATGKGLSIQSFHLLSKIGELDRLVRPGDDDHLLEVHPECSFTMLAGGEPPPSKHTPEGLAVRAALLRAEFGTIAPLRGARLDDVLDAYAVLWTAERFARGEHVTFGDGQRDARGILMRIVV